MKIDEIYDLWGIDCNIDKNLLGDEALKISQLHHKYFKILTNERLVQRKYEGQLKELKLQKQEFFIMGPTEETHKLGWKLPASGKVLRSDLSLYIDSDKEIIDLTLKIGIQHEKVELLESIIKTISNRNFNIKAYIDWEKFKNGLV